MYDLFNYAEYIFSVYVCGLYICVCEAYVWFICLCTEYLFMYGIFVCVSLFTYNLFLNTLYYAQCVHLFILDLCLVFCIWFIYLCPFYV